MFYYLSIIVFTFKVADGFPCGNSPGLLLFCDEITSPGFTFQRAFRHMRPKKQNKE